MVPLTPLLPCAAAGHGKHKVAFLMSDGDNIQWMYNTFAVQPSWWASPDRGKVPLGWTVSPGLVELGARACAHASLCFCLWQHVEHWANVLASAECADNSSCI